MPLDITTTLKDHLAEPITTLGDLMYIKSVDGSGLELYMTSADRAIPFGGQVYEPTAGFVPSTSESKIDLAVDNMSIVGVMDEINLKRSDVLAGRLDYADIRVASVNYRAADLMGDLPFAAGKLGRVQVRGQKFVAEVRGLTQYFQQQMGSVYTVDCRVTRFGNSVCGVDLGPLTKTFTVVTPAPSAPSRIFSTTLTDADGHFDLGLVMWTVGDNQFFKADVKVYLNTNGEVELYEPLPFEVKTGDAGDIVVGCNRSWTRCKFFNNENNYRGFRFLPGTLPLLR
ncbi:MAG: DUF2163 domain-containing protein [Acidimicrobiia bacterium]|nr:DUF2163 domain-containing protein [Acidimicrobiia bacterium]